LNVLKKVARKYDPKWCFPDAGTRRVQGIENRRIIDLSSTI